MFLGLPPFLLKRIPHQCLVGDITARFSQCVTYPPSSSSPDFCRNLIGSVPEVRLADGIMQTYLKDPPQNIVGEGLHFGGGGFGCSPCF